MPRDLPAPYVRSGTRAWWGEFTRLKAKLDECGHRKIDRRPLGMKLPPEGSSPLEFAQNKLAAAEKMVSMWHDIEYELTVQREKEDGERSLAERAEMGRMLAGALEDRRQNGWRGRPIQTIRLEMMEAECRLILRLDCVKSFVTAAQFNTEEVFSAVKTALEARVVNRKAGPVPVTDRTVTSALKSFGIVVAYACRVLNLGTSVWHKNRGMPRGVPLDERGRRQRQPFLTPEEAVRALNVVREIAREGPHRRVFVERTMTLALTGGRPSEVLFLGRRHIHPHTNTMFLSAMKGGELEREVTIWPELRPYLVHHWDPVSDDLVWPWTQKTVKDEEDKLRDAMKEVWERAGIPREKWESTHERGPNGSRAMRAGPLYLWRHSFARLLLSCNRPAPGGGVVRWSADEVGRYLGHRDATQVNDTYAASSRYYTGLLVPNYEDAVRELQRQLDEIVRQQPDDASPSAQPSSAPAPGPARKARRQPAKKRPKAKAKKR